MTVHRRLSDAVATTACDWIWLVTAIVSTSTIGCLFAIRVIPRVGRQLLGCGGRTSRGAMGRRGRRNRASLLVFGAIDLTCA